MSDMETLEADEALELMPLMNKLAFLNLRRKGKGPKFGVFGNRVLYLKSDVIEWYAKWEKEAFTQTKLAARKIVTRKTTAAKIKQGVAKVAKNGKAKEKVSEKELLG